MVQIEQIAPIVTRRLRQQVLYPHLPIEQMLLPEDEQGYHFGLYLENRLIGVLSLFMDRLNHSAQLRKFAIEKTYQCKGYGSSLLQYVSNFARQEQIQTVWCNARVEAKTFYIRNRFKQSGAIFNKNGIFYVRMKKTI